MFQNKMLLGKHRMMVPYSMIYWNVIIDVMLKNVFVLKGEKLMKITLFGK